jgi:hypothetical protein
MKFWRKEEDEKYIKRKEYRKYDTVIGQSPITVTWSFTISFARDTSGPTMGQHTRRYFQAGPEVAPEAKVKL